MGRRVYGATWTPQRGTHADPTPRRNLVRGSSRLRFVDGELVFVAAVLVVLAVASLPLSSPDSAPDNASTHQSTGSGQLDR